MSRFWIFNKKLSKGFTLIELLIVIAVIGVLAAVVLVAIDPIEQLARGRDTGRKSTNVELGRALEANFTNSGGNYIVPGIGPNWTADLQAAGDIKTIPTSPAVPATLCTGGGEIGTGSQFCYKLDVSAPTNPRIVVYIKTESKSEQAKCGALLSWSAYLSAFGRGGTFCKATEPAPSDAVTLFAP